MADIIITPSTGKLEFVDNASQNIRRYAFSLDDTNGVKLDAPLSAAAVIAPVNIVNVTVDNSNNNYPFILASGSAGTGTKTLMMDGTGGTYNPSTNLYTATTNNMSDARGYPTLTILNNGKVLIVGGANQRTGYLQPTYTAEL